MIPPRIVSPAIITPSRSEHDVAVGVAGQHLDAPAVDLVAGVEQLAGRATQCTACDEPLRLARDPVDRRRAACRATTQ